MKSPLFIAICIAGFLLVAMVMSRWLRPISAPDTAPHGFAAQDARDSTLPASDKTLVSLVLLLRKPHALSEADLQRAAGNAFGHPFDRESEYAAKETDRSGLFVMRIPEMGMGIITTDMGYFKDADANSERFKDPEVKRVIQQHTAWMAVDMLGDLPEGGMKAAYANIARLAGQFTDENTLAIMRTSDERVVMYRPEFSVLLRHGEFATIFGEVPEDVVVKTEAGDPELAAAAAEAQKRWPEFLTAFRAGKPGMAFHVKKAFATGAKVEHMWVQVKNIDGQTISGTLNSDPDTITSMKFGQPVTLDAAEVEDWIYIDGKDEVGGFQMKVLKPRVH